MTDGHEVKSNEIVIMTLSVGFIKNENRLTDERSESESINEDSSDNTISGHNNITTSHDISSLPLSRLAGKNLTSVPDIRTCKNVFDFAKFWVFVKSLILFVSSTEYTHIKRIEQGDHTT